VARLDDDWHQRMLAVVDHSAVTVAAMSLHEALEEDIDHVAGASLITCMRTRCADESSVQR